MNLRYFTSTIIIVLLLSSCTSSRYFTDFDPGINFKDYSTFKFYKGRKPAGDKLRKNRLIERNIEKLVTENLSKKGYVKEKGKTDFIIVLHAGSEKKRSAVSTSYGIGGYGYGHYGWGPSAAVTTVHTNNEATLYIDIIDSKTKDLAWRGLGTETIKNYTDREEMYELLSDVVNRILEDFPPEINK